MNYTIMYTFPIIISFMIFELCGCDIDSIDKLSLVCAFGFLAITSKFDDDNNS